ncbi:MAG: hypothetical protein QM757_34365 [Paludibaculum sp.]
MAPEFYVGYLAQAPPRLAVFLRSVVAVIAAAGLATALLLTAGQSPFADSTFEYGRSGKYEGQLTEWPYPMLVSANQRYLLVAPGKHGFSARELDGRWIRLKGTLIRRGEEQDAGSGACHSAGA